MGNLSIARKRALLDLVHASAALQSLYVQTIGGAVQLAGDQVQNKRTSLLEKGPEVKPSDLLFDTLLTLALGQI